MPADITTAVHQVTVENIGTVEVAVSERGEGHPILLLHGGGGPLTVTAWAEIGRAHV